MEKAIFNQLVFYLESNKLVHPNLHGSRSGHSTATALTQLYDTWVEEVEQGNMVGVLLCDQSAAFDLCDHVLLIEKLKLMGVDKCAAAWFSSYLSTRSQSCMIDGHLSDPLNIPQCGVPQGSIGGPILWLVFTCDQPDVIHCHKIAGDKPDRGCHDSQLGGTTGDENVQEKCGLLVGYVDDGAYSVASKKPSVLSDILSAQYNKLADWMNSNRLVINPDKTHLMVMGKRKISVQRLEVSITAGDFEIKPRESEKLLGGRLHHSLSWNYHIRDHSDSMVNQLNKRLNGLRKVCVNASFQSRLMVANGLVISRLTYLITLWGGAPNYLLDVLQVQQLNAARTVCGFESLRWSRRQLLARVKWLSVRQLIFYHDVLQVFKTLNTGVPEFLHNAVTATFPRETRSAAAGQIWGNNRVNGTFAHRAINSYNSVPPDVRTGTLASVKTGLKKWIRMNIAID